MLVVGLLGIIEEFLFELAAVLIESLLGAWLATD